MIPLLGHGRETVAFWVVHGDQQEILLLGHGRDEVSLSGSFKVGFVVQGSQFPFGLFKGNN